MAEDASDLASRDLVAAAPGATVGTLGEHATIARIRALLGAAALGRSARIVLGIGDDAAVVAPEKRQVSVLTTDAMVDGVHFDLARVPPRLVGRKALAVNLSDVAAMGARPDVALLSLGLPPELPVVTLDALIGGLSEEAIAHGVTIVGGNVTRTTGPLFIDVTLVGWVHPRRVLTRSGGRPGHELYLSGAVGGAAAGLRLLDGGHSFASVGLSDGPPGPVVQIFPGTNGSGSAPDGPTGTSTHGDSGSTDASHSEAYAPSPLDAADRIRAALMAYAHPQARVRMGVSVAGAKAASACVDLSDGLADAVRQMATGSRTGAIVDLDKLPLHQGLDLIDELERLPMALSGGEDYELLFAVPPRRRRAFLAAVQRKGHPPIHRIGVLTADPRVRARRAGLDEPLPAGFVHFR